MKDLATELYSALERVTDVLSKTPDSEWNRVTPIQGWIHQSQEIVSEWLDQLQAEESTQVETESTQVDEDDCDCNDRSWYGDYHDSACPLGGD